MTKKMIATAVIALFAGAAGAAGIAGTSDVFAILDADNSGAVSKEEASVMPSVTERWGELDADANGELSAEELVNYEKKEVPSS